MIGADISRVDGIEKLSGRAAYVDDVAIPGVWHGGTVRGQVARGRIKAIHFDPAINWDEFVVVDHRDISGLNQIKLIDVDQPALAAGEIHHKHEAILLIAHPSVHKLREALRAVRVEVEPLPAVLDPRTPPTPELIQYKNDNVLKHIEIRKGDVGPVFAKAAHVVEGEYVTGAQEHVYLETQGMAVWREKEMIVVRGSMQCPYYVLDGLTHFFGRPREAFRVIQAPVGGGFGGKEDYPSLLAVHAVLLAEKAGAPVKMIYDRQEDMAATTKRHPSRVRHRTALNRDGRLLGMEIDVLLDGGAYVTLSPVVLSRGCIHAAGPYSCENILVRGEAKLTNSPPYGAFRGFGAPQTLFAIERHMDVIAERIGIDPVELRRRNLVCDGKTLATGQVVKDGTDLVAVQGRALELAMYEERRREHAEFNRTHPYLRRGMGFATFHHGAGFTGGGETYLASEVWIDGLPDGSVELLTAQTDMGQGTTTILSQIVAERLGLAADRVRVATPDTSRVPNSGPTVASRTAMVVGHLVEKACDDLRERIGATNRVASASDAIVAWHRAHPGEKLVGRSKYQKPESIQWDDKTYRGDAYACYSWATHVAEVEVDLRTYRARVTDYVALQEVGRVLNPTLATGQIAGGVVQGIGWALYENVVLEDGAMKNCQMTNYIIPSASDLPPIRVYFDESRSPFGPGGAKGIGELPMDGPGPAIANALSRAVGVPQNEIPVTPERLMQTLEARRG